MKNWDDDLWLLTIEEYNSLPDGFSLICIDGKEVVKGKDYIDLDLRFNCMAYGLTSELAAKQNFNETFLLWLLKS